MIVVGLVLATATLVAHRLTGEARRAGLAAPRRHGVLASAVVMGTILVAMTEALSVVRLLTPPGITIGWGLAALAAAVVARRGKGAGGEPVRPDPVVGVAIAAMALIALATGVVAWMAPPNTWDSMTYHMSRVVQWRSHASVAHYPTHIARQILYTPGAELGLLHLELAWGGDRLANLLQWAAYLVAGAAASLVAARLGADPRGQTFAALFCATAPMAILESSSTQNDLVGAVWLVALAYFALLWRERPSAWVAAGAGASLGLALVTKITAYVLVLPWIAPIVLRGLRGGRAAPATMLAVAFALNAGHYARHAALWWAIPREVVAAAPPAAAAPADGRRASPPSGGSLRYLNSAMSPGLLVSNLLRNVGLHVATPWASARDAVDRAMAGVHAALGVDPGDPRTTYPSGRVFRAPALERHEDVAPNPLHLALVLVALGLLVARRRFDEPARQGGLVAAAFVLFCLVFKWQPWHTRLHLPLFVLAAPVVAATLRPGMVVAAGAVLLVASIPWVVANDSRPLPGVLATPRIDQYFANRPALRGPYARAAAELRARACRDVGLVIGGNEWEYPLWVMLEAGGPVRIIHVDVRNESRFARDPAPGVVPCAVVAIGVEAREAMTWRGREHRRVLADGPVQVLVP